jgi:hypothetical protein
MPRAGILGRHEALGRGRVGQLWTSRNVTNGVNGSHLGSGVFVNLDETLLIGLQPGILEL